MAPKHEATAGFQIQRNEIQIKRSNNQTRRKKNLIQRNKNFRPSIQNFQQLKRQICGKTILALCLRNQPGIEVKQLEALRLLLRRDGDPGSDDGRHDSIAF
jgi:hypothetical protein